MREFLYLKFETFQKLGDYTGKGLGWWWCWLWAASQRLVWSMFYYPDQMKNNGWQCLDLLRPRYTQWDKTRRQSFLFTWNNDQIFTDKKYLVPQQLHSHATTSEPDSDEGYEDWRRHDGEDLETDIRCWVFVWTGETKQQTEVWDCWEALLRLSDVESVPLSRYF